MILHMGPMLEKMIPLSVRLAANFDVYHSFTDQNCLWFLHLLKNVTLHLNQSNNSNILLFHSTEIFPSPLPVPQALGLAWHAEAISIVGEVAVNKRDEDKVIKMGGSHNLRFLNIFNKQQFTPQTSPLSFVASLKKSLIAIYHNTLKIILSFSIKKMNHQFLQ